MRPSCWIALVLGSSLACTEPAKPPPNSSGDAQKPAKLEPAKLEPAKLEPGRIDPAKAQPLPPVDGFFMAEGAPQPRACVTAKDCKGDTIPDLDNPCCQNPITLEPYAWAYQTWLNGWRTEHCEAVTCPPPPNPSQPPACAFDNDCVDGLCVDACD